MKSGRQLIRYVWDVIGFQVPLGGFRGGNDIINNYFI
jgi:hypothetical protein